MKNTKSVYFIINNDEFYSKIISKDEDGNDFTNVDDAITFAKSLEIESFEIQHATKEVF